MRINSDFPTIDAYPSCILQVSLFILCLSLWWCIFSSSHKVHSFYVFLGPNYSVCVMLILPGELLSRLEINVSSLWSICHIIISNHLISLGELPRCTLAKREWSFSILECFWLVLPGARWARWPALSSPGENGDFYF